MHIKRTKQQLVLYSYQKWNINQMAKSVPRAVYVFHINSVVGNKYAIVWFASSYFRSARVCVCVCMHLNKVTRFEGWIEKWCAQGFMYPFYAVAGILHQFIYGLNNLYKIHIITLETFNDDYVEHKWINNYARAVYTCWVIAFHFIQIVSCNREILCVCVFMPEITFTLLC